MLTPRACSVVLAIQSDIYEVLQAFVGLLCGDALEREQRLLLQYHIKTMYAS